jgi:hypothetical protein
MTPLFVLVRSPSVGPARWAPVAGELIHRGRSVLVPSLLGVAEGGAGPVAVTDALLALVER